MPLVSLGVAWLVGIYAASRAALPALAIAPLVALAAGFVVAFRHSPSQRWIALCAAAALLGALRYSLAQPHFDNQSLATYNNRNQPATIVGVVAAEPDVRDVDIRLRLRSETLAFGNSRPLPVNGLALVRAPRYPEYHYGDRLSITGQLESPPLLEDFDYRAYLARQGVYSQITRPKIERLSSGHGFAPFAWLLAFKAHVKSVIARILPEPQASLLTGILLGIESGIPANVREAFRLTGTSHIIAISGFNLTLLAGLLGAVATRLFGKRHAFYAIAAGLLLYTVLVGASSSVVRAAIMSLLYLWAVRLGRQSAALNSLFAAATLMTLIDANTFWDVGFWLSFAATLGLILYTNRLQAFFECMLRRVLSAERARRVVGWLSDALIVTLAAQITTLPIIVYVFKQLSFVSLLANVLVLPAQAGLMVFGGAATLAGLVWIPLGQVMGWGAWCFLSWTIGVVEFMARIPCASVSVGQVHAGWAAAYYAGLGALTGWGSLPAERRAALAGGLAGKVKPGYALAGLAIAAALLGAALLRLPDGELHVEVLDVGDADAVLITTPSGRRVLVDAGASASTILDHIGRRLPFWERALDAAVIARSDDAHLAAWAAVLERYRAGVIVAPPTVSGASPVNTPAALRLSQVIAGQRARVTPALAGARLQLDGGVELEIVGAPLTGAAGASVRVVYGSVSFLLAGESAPPRGWPASTVLRAAGHGSERLNTPEMLAAVNPSAAIISVARRNRFGLPSPALLERLSGRAVLRTDQRGSIAVSTDGTRLKVRTGE